MSNAARKFDLPLESRCWPGKVLHLDPRLDVSDHSSSHLSKKSKTIARYSMHAGATLLKGVLIVSISCWLITSASGTSSPNRLVPWRDPYLAEARSRYRWPEDSSARTDLATSSGSIRWRRQERRTDQDAVKTDTRRSPIPQGKTSARSTSVPWKKVAGNFAAGNLMAPQSLSKQRGLNRNQVVRSASQSESGQTRSLPEAQALQASSEGTKCALILQRTYVRKLQVNEPADYEPNGNENPDSEEDRLEPTGKQERVCITYEHVNQAISEAMQRRKFAASSVPDSEIESIEPSLAVLAQLGELNQEVTRLLARKFDLSADEILNGLPLIDMSRTDFWPICPLMVRPIRCDPSGRFRAFTGHCNNLMNPSWGAAQTPFVRFVAPQHPDGVQAERVSVEDGSALPSARLITSMVHQDHDQPSSDLSLLIMVWGQIIDHDVALAAPPRGKFITCRPSERLETLFA